MLILLIDLLFSNRFVLFGLKLLFGLLWDRDFAIIFLVIIHQVLFSLISDWISRPKLLILELVEHLFNEFLVYVFE